MSFTPLGNQRRLDALPLVLAGPILRRVQQDAVTVWVALKEPRTVKLEVFAGTVPNTPLMKGSQEPVRLGERLHVVVVTARPVLPDGLLQPGEAYLYDLDFNPGSGSPERLDSPKVLTALGRFEAMRTVAYPGLGTPPGFAGTLLPSFALPPRQLSDLRLVHGSCRKPHGEGSDALVALDVMLERCAANPGEQRPHQLYLTGDQIYADDVADALLFLIKDAEKALGLRGSAPPKPPDDADELRPGRRSHYVTSAVGMTAVYGVGLEPTEGIAGTPSWAVAKSHLLSFAEYCLMYMFAWSPVLWPDEQDLPTYDQVFPGGIPEGPLAELGGDKKHRERYRDELDQLRRFLRAIRPVRRALANVPTYMIFDDHDVTDDWFISSGWCDRVLRPEGAGTAPEEPGPWVIRNALLAYTIFQAWGNTPEQFDDGDGAALLAAAATWSGRDAALDTALADVPQPDGSTAKGLRHQPGWPTWHYTVRGPDVKVGGKTGPLFTVVVLDGRTWRTYPGQTGDPASLIDDTKLAEQLGAQPETCELTFVVAPAPVVGNAVVEWVQALAKGRYGVFAGDRESWQLQRATYEALLARLAARGPLAPGDRQPARIVLLSGDVHYGFAARIRYWGDHPWRQLARDGSTAVLAQLTASACKNQELKTLVAGVLKYGLPLPATHRNTFGWSGPVELQRRFRIVMEETGQEVVSPPRPERLGKGGGVVLDRSDAEQAWVITRAAASAPSDWAYRREYIAAAADLLNAGDWEALATTYDLFTAGSLKDLARVGGAAIKLLHREVVGLNNLGEVTLRWGTGEDKLVTQKLWAYRRTGLGGGPPGPIEVYREFKVLLALGDDKPEIPVVNP
jgi:hypothetical protein